MESQHWELVEGLSNQVLMSSIFMIGIVIYAMIKIKR